MAKLKEVEFLVLGSGLSGLVVAAHLEKAGAAYLVLESQDEIGGNVKALTHNDFHFDFGMKSTPIGPNIHENPLVRLKESLSLNVGLEPWTESPLCLEKGELKPFLGFGDKLQTSLADEINYFTQSPRLMVSGGMKSLLDELLKIIPKEKILLKKHVTGFQVQNECVQDVIVNGAEIYKAKKIISTLEPATLAKLFPQNFLPQRTQQRLSSAAGYGIISLDIATETRIFEGKNMLLLSETTDDPVHVLGLFISNVDPLRSQHPWQVSSWMTLVDSETIPDDEAVSKSLRTMRRLISRAFPLLAENTKWERILALESSLGGLPQFSLEKNLTLPGAENVYVAGASFRSAYGLKTRNFSAAIESAARLAEALVGKIPTSAMRESTHELQSSPS